MESTSSKYLVVWASVVLVMMSIIVAINRLVDPLHLFNSEQVSMSAEGYLRETKPWQVINKKPDRVLIGNSRNYYASDVSLLPGNNNYNFSLRGAKFATLHVAFRHAAFHAPLQTAYIAVDSICDSPTNGNMSHFSTVPSEYYKANLNRYAYLLSATTLIKSITSQAKQSYPLFNNYGQRVEYPFGDYGHTLAARVEKKEEQKVDLLLKSAKRSKTKFRCGIQELEMMLRFAHENSIKLVLFINPQHCRYMEISYLAKGNVLNESLKRRVVETNEKVAEQMGKEPFLIWDFLLVNQYTTEDLSVDNANYWWEPSHFTPALGNKMMNVMATGDVEGASIGALLTRRTLEKHLHLQRKLYSNWRQSRKAETHKLMAKLIERGMPLYQQRELGQAKSKINL